MWLCVYLAGFVLTLWLFPHIFKFYGELSHYGEWWEPPAFHATVAVGWPLFLIVAISFSVWWLWDLSKDFRKWRRERQAGGAK